MNFDSFWEVMKWGAIPFGGMLAYLFWRVLDGIKDLISERLDKIEEIYKEHSDKDDEANKTLWEEISKGRRESTDASSKLWREIEAIRREAVEASRSGVREAEAIRSQMSAFQVEVAKTYVKGSSMENMEANLRKDIAEVRSDVKEMLKLISGGSHRVPRG